MNFTDQFRNLTQLPQPLAWQRRLYDEFLSKGELPSALDLPTGLGKTSVMVLWLMALANGAKLPRRLVYVVDRRAVVDQATNIAQELREALEQPINAALKLQLYLADKKLSISTLRGQFVDNREWLDDPSVPAIIVGTVDMVGSRLLFAGYDVSPKMRSYQAGLLGCDSLIVLDEAHLVPPFEALLDKIEADRASFAGKSSEHIPPFRLLSLSATGRMRGGTAFALQDSDISSCEITKRRLGATKILSIVELKAEEKLEDILVREAKTIAERKPARCIVFCNSREIAEKVAKELQKSVDEVELLVGARRVFERQAAYERLKSLGFIAGEKASNPNQSVFLVATSAGEVGVDLDAFDLVCDCVTWERMVQRLGRVNRRGERDAKVVVLLEAIKAPDKDVTGARQEKVRLEHKASRTKDEEKSLLKHIKTVEKYEQSTAQVNAKQAPFRKLLAEGANLSPGELRKLKSRTLSDQAILEAATEKPPLRAELSRALVDAWSMTSLKNHTGRPEVAPWLRGWVVDEPQTKVIWRTHLPLLNGKLPSAKILEDFFEAAPPHVSEVLETETYRVKNWLLKLAEGVKSKKATDSFVPPIRESLLPSQPVLFFLASDNSIKQVLTWGEVTALARKADTDRAKKDQDKGKDALETSLIGATIIVNAKLGGLSKLGLLDDKDDNGEAKPTIDDESVTWIGGIHKDQFGFHVFSSQQPTEGKRKGALESFRMVTQATEEGEATHWLVVLNAQTQEARSSGPPQELHEHQDWAAQWMDKIARRLQLPARLHRLIVLAARFHDEGKQVERWQRAFNAPRDGKIYAKVNAQINQTLLAGYRHEFGSLDFVKQDADFLLLPADEQCLVLHLIAAHHGHARPLISTNGMDKPPSALEADATDVALRFASLQKQFGPWGLAWLEALLKAADARASNQNQYSKEQRE